MKYISFIVFIILYQVSLSQDIHFSQFYNSPLTLNPALTGQKTCYRAVLNNRDQWRAISDAYKTTAVSLDISPRIQTLFKNNYGIGVSFYNDRAGSGNYTTNMIALSGAYHRTYGSVNPNRISVGVQAGYFVRSIAIDDLIFSSQYNEDIIYDPSLSNKENIAGTSINGFDVNIGIHNEIYLFDKQKLSTGISYYNLLNHQESFYNDDNSLSRRLALYGYFDVKLGSGWGMMPGVFYMNQSISDEFLLGVNFKKKLKSTTFGTVTALAGLWGRTKDAFIIDMGVMVKKITVQLSYDVNLSDLEVVSDNRGGLEFSVIFEGGCSPRIPTKVTVPCKRF